MRAALSMTGCLCLLRGGGVPATGIAIAKVRSIAMADACLDYQLARAHRHAVDIAWRDCCTKTGDWSRLGPGLVPRLARSGLALLISGPGRPPPAETIVTPSWLANS